MIDDFSERLLTWFDQHGRKHLPWQHDINHYRVWVSEIMLQQTQVATVIGYYERFMARFPDINALAAASQDEVLHLWTGLGYYARARNLHKTAQQLHQHNNSQFPDDLDGLIDLPGIGRSTAGAIMCIAGGGRAPILDGNVKRVLARCFGISGWPAETQVANQLWTLAGQLTPHDRVADYTQAIMDLGATLCTRSRPQCDICPFATECIAATTARTSEFPGKKPKKVMPIRTTCMLLIENPRGEFLLEKRPSQGLWGGLWGFPEIAPAQLEQHLTDQRLQRQQAPHLPEFRHTFSHFHLDIAPVHVTYATADSCLGIDQVAETHAWYSLQAPAEIGLTRPVTRIFEQLALLRAPVMEANH
ncbi:MAG: A/G-specific adenine glycosylase [Candidatus Azotimanducaceae bacterium]|jgi:A/G-specific adenine glycosylase